VYMAVTVNGGFFFKKNVQIRKFLK
jgi:hypothetical protein